MSNQAVQFSLTPTTLAEAMQVSELLSKSELVPKHYRDKPANVFVAMMKGLEIGLSPMAALESIAFIGDRTTLWGDGLLAVVQRHPDYEWMDESASTPQEGVCTIQRRGEPTHTARFTLEDAKRAGLLGKTSIWAQHTGRMLKLRARTFALRDKFADALKGITSAEEVMDTTTDEPGPTAHSTLKEKLKELASAECAAPAHSAAPLMEADEPTPTPPSPTPRPDDLAKVQTDMAAADLEILLHDYRQAIAAAEKPKLVAAVANEALADPSLTSEAKATIHTLVKARMAELAGTRHES